MIGYVARRLLQLLPVLFIGSVGIWAMIYAVPGGPVGQIKAAAELEEEPRLGRRGLRDVSLPDPSKVA